MNIEGIVVEEMEVEEIVLEGESEVGQAIARACNHADPRLSPLSDTTKALIALRFGGDVDLAIEHAEYQAKTMHRPQPWVHELVKVHHNWKYSDHRRTAR